MKKIFLFLFVFVIAFFFSGCYKLYNKSNPYYTMMRVSDRINYKRSKKIAVYNYTEDNLNYFLNKGYTIKGKSAIRSTYIGDDYLIEAGKQCGASIILYKYKYVGTSSGTQTIPWLNRGDTYTVTQSTKGNIDVDGYGNNSTIKNNGYSLVNYSSQSNATYSQKTTTTIKAPDYYTFRSVSYSNSFYDQYALFLISPEKRSKHFKKK